MMGDFVIRSGDESLFPVIFPAPVVFLRYTRILIILFRGCMLRISYGDSDYGTDGNNGDEASDDHFLYRASCPFFHGFSSNRGRSFPRGSLSRCGQLAE